MTFTIDPENNITAYDGIPATEPNTKSFSSEKELAKLTADWPAARLADTWNAFAGVTPFDELKPVKKFTDRKAAVARIWKAIQRLSPVAGPQAAAVAPKKARSKKSPTAGETPATARDGSKKAEVLQMLRRPDGASLAEIMTATGWQAHTVRGFVSGTLTKKLGLTVESFRREDKQRTYRIT